MNPEVVGLMIIFMVAVGVLYVVIPRLITRLFKMGERAHDRSKGLYNETDTVPLAERFPQDMVMEAAKRAQLAKFCPVCGSPTDFSKQYCTHCGQAIR